LLASLVRESWNQIVDWLSEHQRVCGKA